MYLSRSESRNEERQRRKKRLRRLLIVNLTMLTLIVIFAGALYVGGDWQGWQGFGARSGEPQAQGGADGGSEAAEGGAANGSAGTEPPAEAGGPAAGDAAEAPTGESSGSSPEAPTGSAGAPRGPAERPSGTEDGSLAGGAADGSSGASGGGPDGAAGEAPAVPASGGDAGTVGEPDGDKVRLAFVGDLLLASTVEQLMRRNGLDYPFREALPFLQRPDLTAGNLETPITTRGTPAPDKQYVFKGAPDLLQPLKEAGFDVVGLANNHTLDQGMEGLFDTMDYLEKIGIRHAGGGSDDTEAFRPAVLEAKGMKIAYFSFSRVVPEVSWKADKYTAGVAETYDSTRAVAAIERAREACDLIVVLVHWGKEREDYPVDHQKKLARDYIDAGADLVIGAHPHVLQGFEQYKGKWIAYSLGNFVFTTTATEKTRDTGVLDAVCSRSGECELQFHPMRAEASQPVPMEKEAAQSLMRRLAELSYGAAIDAEGRIEAIASP